VLTTNDKVTKCSDGVKIQVKADIGFINENPPMRFSGKLVYVCMLAETSDGRKIHFARISGQKLGRGQTLVFPALLTDPGQSINCYVMCDSIAGSLRGATVKPQITPSSFPVLQAPESITPPRSNTSKRRAEPAKPTRRRSTNSDEFGDDGIDDEELVKATINDLEFEHIDNFANPVDAITKNNTVKNKSAAKPKGPTKTANVVAAEDDQDPVQLSNGKWACKHACKDKIACKHLCCKEGMDKPPKKPTVAKHSAPHEDRFQSTSLSSQAPKVTQSKLQLTTFKRKFSSAVEELDLTQDDTRSKKLNYVKNGPRDYRELHQLHKTIQKKDLPSTIYSVMHSKAKYCYSEGGEHNLSFLQKPAAAMSDDWSDYGDLPLDELSSHFNVPRPPTHRDPLKRQEKEDTNNLMDYSAASPVVSRRSDTFGDDDSLLGDAMIGLADSETLQAVNDHNDSNDAHRAVDVPNMDYDTAFQDDDFPMDVNFTEDDHNDWSVCETAPTTRPVPTRNIASDHRRVPFYDSTSSLNQPNGNIRVPITPLTSSLLQEHILPKDSASRLNFKKPMADDVDVLDLLDILEDQPVKEKHVPDAFKELEPWLFKEYGDIVELVDG
jgi:ATP-dependent DNA helicase HFM1/MER3